MNFLYKQFNHCNNLKKETLQYFFPGILHFISFTQSSIKQHAHILAFVCIYSPSPLSFLSLSSFFDLFFFFFFLGVASSWDSGLSIGSIDLSWASMSGEVVGESGEGEYRGSSPSFSKPSIPSMPSCDISCIEEIHTYHCTQRIICF